MDEITSQQIAAFSDMARLGHDAKRVEELGPKVRELFASVYRLREEDVRGFETAVNYPVRTLPAAEVVDVARRFRDEWGGTDK